MMIEKRKQEIIEKVFHKTKKKWFGNPKFWKTVDGVSYIVNYAIEEALNLADIHHRKVVEGIKEKLKCNNREAQFELNIAWQDWLDEKDEEISRLKAERDELLIWEKNSISILSCEEKIKQENFRIRKKLEEWIKYHNFDSNVIEDIREYFAEYLTPSGHQKKERDKG